MWWREHYTAWLRVSRFALALAAASLTAGCFEPLYGTHPSVGSESVHDKLGAVEIPVIKAVKGTPLARIGVALRNSLQFDLNGGAGPNAPTHRLVVAIGTSQISVIVDVVSGRPDAQVDVVIASYQLVEIATNKTVVNDLAVAQVDYDIPGSAQRFAKQRAQRDAEDRAIEVAAEAIRNRLASYFVAGT
jgi:LPS-assembly lipoprotein